MVEGSETSGRRDGDSTWARLADLAIDVDDWSLEGHARETSSGFVRKSTEIVLEGAGRVGRGEDVTYTPEAHEALQAAPPNLPLVEASTLTEASAALDGVDLFPDGPPERERFRAYRRWGVESALLDLALRQADRDLATVLDRKPAPVRFVVSTSLGDPPSAEPVEGWHEVDPALEFKVDATRPWPDAVLDALVATGRVRAIDLKAQYPADAEEEGSRDVDEEAVWMGRPDVDFYRRLVEAFPDAVIEDPGVTEATRPILEAARDRLSWDAPVHDVVSFEALPFEVRRCNVKPSRFGSLERLFDFLDHAAAEGLRLYGGGQFELGVGRGQLHALASLYYPEGPNDVAPRSYNDPAPRAGLPSSPLEPPATSPGFGWHVG